MTEIYAHEMPIALTTNALYYGACFSLLNPPEDKDESCSKSVFNFIRIIARTVYQVAVVILFPLGVAYHLTSALVRTLQSWIWSDPKEKERYKDLSFEHLKCAGFDAMYPIDNILVWFSNNSRHAEGATPFALYPELAVATACSGSLVKTTPLAKLEGAALTLYGKMSNAFKGAANFYHKTNIENMEKGLYRFDELVYAALDIRKHDNKRTSFPRYSDLEVRTICLRDSYKGDYGNNFK